MQEYELICDTGEWKVIYHNETQQYMYIDNETKEFKHLQLVAELTYSINDTLNNDIDTLFNNYCYCETVNNDTIKCYWFKEYTNEL